MDHTKVNNERLNSSATIKHVDIGQASKQARWQLVVCYSDDDNNNSNNHVRKQIYFNVCANVRANG